MQRPTPTEISNEFVTLRPLSVEEADAYVDIGQDMGTKTCAAGKDGARHGGGDVCRPRVISHF